MFFQQRNTVFDGRPAFNFVFSVRRDAQRLTKILLMNANRIPVEFGAVISVNDEIGYITDLNDMNFGSG